MRKYFDHPNQLRLKLEAKASLPRQHLTELKTESHLGIAEFFGRDKNEASLQFLRENDLQIVVMEGSYAEHRTSGYNIYAVKPFLSDHNDQELFDLIEKLFGHITKNRHDARYYSIEFYLATKAILSAKKSAPLQSNF
jgi:hypothetical protein